MKFPTSLAAAALAAASLATPAQAMAAGQQLSPAQYKNIGSALRRGGIELTFVPRCPTRDLAGTYNYKRMTLKICENNIRSLDEMNAVVAHEMVHATQHCVGSLMGVEGLLPIHTMLAQGNPDRAHEWLQTINARTAHRAATVEASAQFNGRMIATSLEREAYALESEPMAVLGLYKAACLREFN